jgi:polysaccharide export outer membrane protein
MWKRSLKKQTWCLSWRLVWVCLFFLFVLVKASVGEEPPPPAVSLAPYRLGPGDVISIRVAGHEEWSADVEVRPDGRITYYSVGEINVTGMTVAELTEKLRYEIGPGGRHLKNPSVTVNVVRRRPAVAYVLGGVARPGSVELPLGFETAKRILGMVGGVQPEADLRHAKIYRSDRREEVVDLAAELEGKKEDTVLYAGDVLVIPLARPVVVGVLGEVRKSGQFVLPPGQTQIDLLTVVLQAGGIGPEADETRALILRATGEVEEVALRDVLKQNIRAPVLRDRDVLWVLPKPEQQFVQVVGAVAAPGRYPFRPGMGLGEALALAGQLREEADAGNIILIHSDGQRESIDLRPLLGGRDLDLARRPVQPDDIVLVPRQEKMYTVLGAVSRPGIFQWTEQTKLTDALARAGGPVERVAALSNVILVRRVGSQQPIVMELDAEELLRGKNEAANLVLLPDDLVYVPSTEEKALRERLELPLLLLSIASNLRYIVHGW